MLDQFINIYVNFIKIYLKRSVILKYKIQIKLVFSHLPHFLWNYYS